MNGEHSIYEQLLFQRISKGDIKSYEIIYHRYADALLRHAYSVLNSEFWAEEIVQEAFMKIWKDRHLLDKIEKPSAYLYRIVSNLCFSRIRVREKEIKIQYYITSQSLTILPEANPEKETRDQITNWLNEAIERLPGQQKIVYRLRYQQDKSFDQIAVELCLARFTVRNHFRAAIQSIRQYLAGRTDLLMILWILINIKKT